MKTAAQTSRGCEYSIRGCWERSAMLLAQVAATWLRFSSLTPSFNSPSTLPWYRSQLRSSAASGSLGRRDGLVTGEKQQPARPTAPRRTTRQADSLKKPSQREAEHIPQRDHRTLRFPLASRSEASILSCLAQLNLRGNRSGRRKGRLRRRRSIEWCIHRGRGCCYPADPVRGPC
jgi:hypothetical protein